MAYHISRDGTQLGIFTEDEVIEGLEKGDILASDQLWTEGMEDWQPVHEVIEVDEDEEEAPTELVVPPAPEKVYTPLDEDVELASAKDQNAATVEEPQPPQTAEKPVAEPAKAPAAAAPAVVYHTVARSLELGQYGTAGTAIASMVLGILSLISGLITGVPAILCGHMARSSIRRSGGAYSGDGLAVAGLILGYVTSTLMILWLALLLGGFPVPLSQTVQGIGKEYKVKSEGRELVKALKHYAEKHANKFPHALEALVDDKELEPERLKQLQSTDLGPSWKGASGWEYLGNSMPDGGFGDKPLLISHAADADGQRLVIFQDASATKAEIQTK